VVGIISIAEPRPSAAASDDSTTGDDDETTVAGGVETVQVLIRRGFHTVLPDAARGSGTSAAPATSRATGRPRSSRRGNYADNSSHRLGTEQGKVGE
jgi:hypothetical protein